MTKNNSKSIPKIKVLIDTSPLENAHADRGVGAYTRYLSQALEKIDQLEVKRSTELKKQEKFKLDIVHYPFFDLFFPTLPLVKTTKTVVTIHDVIPLVFPEHYQPGVRGTINLRRQKLALKNVNKIITDSQASAQDIEKYLNVAASKIKVVHLAGNPEIKQQPQEEVEKVRRKYSLPKNYLLYVGDINYNKNIPQLIKALKFLPARISLVLLGSNFKEQDIAEWQWIETQIAMSDVEDRVEFISEVKKGDDQTLSAIYSGAVSYVQPSLYEGFGLPVLEAMQCKTPVIAANNSSLIEVCGGHASMVEPTAEAMVEAVKQVLAWSDEEREELVEQALQWAQSFSWEKTAAETAEIYQEILS
jgi:glycosyltransferase involved in cell wall biosynthesis